MKSKLKSRSARFAGRVLLVLMALSCQVGNAVGDQNEVLKHADAIKASNQVEFTQTIRQLEAQSSQLNPEQTEYLHYLQAWQDGYSGDYGAAIPLLDSIIANSKNVTLKFRASVSVVNILEIASRYEEAYERLSQLLDMLPQISDSGTRLLGVGVAAQLYNFAGQYDLALSYSNKLIAAPDQFKMACKGYQLRIDALFRSGKLRWPSDDISSGFAACSKIDDPVFANLLRVDVARLDLAQNRFAEAIALLNENLESAKATRYPFLISSVHAVLGQAYFQTGDTEKAQTHALLAIDSGIKKEFTQAEVDAYEVLYKVAQKQGNYQAALDYHEKFFAADKGYLNDTSARLLAYQMVKQQVLEKKAQVDALSKQNQVLQLQQAVSQKSVEARNLSLLLLFTILSSIGVYAWRTKRSEVKFMKLARRDGLTDIYNRQYFVEASEHELQYCQKSVRDLSIIVIDLDHFKLINDTHGHAAGDFALKRSVAMCQQHLRSIDVFGRLGGEEFGILMPDCVPERAADFAEQMRQSIEGLAASAEGPEFPVRASFGVTAARWSGYDLRQLLAHADSALYQAKREGRNRVVQYSKTMAAQNDPPPVVPERRQNLSYSAREDGRR